MLSLPFPCATTRHSLGRGPHLLPHGPGKPPTVTVLALGLLSVYHTPALTLPTTAPAPVLSLPDPCQSPRSSSCSACGCARPSTSASGSAGKSLREASGAGRGASLRREELRDERTVTLPSGPSASPGTAVLSCCTALYIAATVLRMSHNGLVHGCRSLRHCAPLTGTVLHCHRQCFPRQPKARDFLLAGLRACSQLRASWPTLENWGPHWCTIHSTSPVSVAEGAARWPSSPHWRASPLRPSPVSLRKLSAALLARRRQLLFLVCSCKRYCPVQYHCTGPSCTSPLYLY